MVALLALLARQAVQKPNFVATRSCFIIYIKVLDTSCFRKVTFITLWELAKTKISIASSLFLLLIPNFGKVTATHMVQRFVFGGKQFRIASSAWGIIVLCQETWVSGIVCGCLLWRDSPGHLIS